MEIILIILSVIFLLIAGFFIPVLLQIRRTSKSMAETLQHLNQGLPLILKNLEEITTNINRTATTIHHQVEELSVTLGKIQGIVSLLIGLEEIVRRRIRLSFAQTLKTSLAVARGIRVFIDCLLGKRPK